MEGMLLRTRKVVQKDIRNVATWADMLPSMMAEWVLLLNANTNMFKSQHEMLR